MTFSRIDALAGSGQPLAVCGRNVRRERLERLVLGALRRVGIKLCIELTWHPRDRDLGGHPAQLHSGLHAHDQLIDLCRPRVEPLEVRLIIAHRRKARALRKLRKVELRAVELRHGRPEIEKGARERRAQLVEGDGLIELVPEYAQGDTIGRRQLPRIHPAQAVAKIDARRAPAIDRRGRLIGQPVVVPVVADSRRQFGVLTQHPLPVLVEDRLRLGRCIHALIWLRAADPKIAKQSAAASATVARNGFVRMVPLFLRSGASGAKPRSIAISGRIYE